MPAAMSSSGGGAPIRRAVPAMRMTAATRATSVRASSTRASSHCRAARSASGSGQLAQHRLAQGVEAHPSDVQGPAMEVLQRERRAFPLLDLVAQLHPEPFADLVRRRLPRPAEVAVELEAQPRLALVGVRGQVLPGLVVG